MRVALVRRTLPLRAWAALCVAALGLGILLSPIFTPTDADTLTGDGDAEPIAFVGEPSTAADTSRTDGATALEVLATLPVKGRAAKTGYDRALFGQRWLDVDRNGCDTRTLTDPFTGRVIDFTRGQGTSALVQIDHVVALSDAWQKGAQQLTADQRATFANDPLNLLAVDGPANS